MDLLQANERIRTRQLHPLASILCRDINYDIEVTCVENCLPFVGHFVAIASNSFYFTSHYTNVFIPGYLSKADNSEKLYLQLIIPETDPMFIHIISKTTLEPIRGQYYLRIRAMTNKEIFLATTSIISKSVTVRFEFDVQSSNSLYGFGVVMEMLFTIGHCEALKILNTGQVSQLQTPSALKKKAALTMKQQ